MDLVLTYSSNKPVEDCGTDFKMIFKKILFLTFYMKKIAFFVTKPAKT
jgi:hypothetical protein